MTVPVVVDTNIYFSALYSPEGNEARVIRRAIEGDIVALSPETVHRELERNLLGKLNYTDEEVRRTLSTLPTVWVPRAEYQEKLDEAKEILDHTEDGPILACALAFDSGVLTGNTSHFDTSAVRERTVVWRSRELQNYLEDGRVE